MTRPARTNAGGLTPRQQQVLHAIRDIFEQSGTAPTVRELADRLGCSVTTAQTHIVTLAAKGVIYRHPGKARAIVIPDSHGRRPAPLAAVTDDRRPA